MCEVIHQFLDPYRDPAGVEYDVSVCGEARPSGLWEAWLEFLPLEGGPLLRTCTEVVQLSREDIVFWVYELDPQYLAAALERARELSWDHDSFVMEAPTSPSSEGGP